MRRRTGAAACNRRGTALRAARCRNIRRIWRGIGRQTRFATSSIHRCMSNEHTRQPGRVEPLRRTRDTIVMRQVADTSSPMVAAAAAPDLAGRVLARRYALTQVLGSGGMGHVFKALDWERRDLPEGDRHVAIKILRQDGERGGRLLADLRREFYCAQALAHPNIVKVYETGQDGDLVFFTMELLEGESLRELMQRHSPHGLPRQRVWELIRDIGAGVAHAHARQVVHGDLKPSNIMVTRADEVRILDFGASGTLRRMPEATDDALRRDTIPAVTPAYACCELLAGQLADPRDDLYALACIAYELLSGRHPFQGRSAFAARRAGMQPQRPAGLSGRQWRVLRQGLAWQREDRDITVAQWLTNLRLGTAMMRLPSNGGLARLRAAMRARAPAFSAQRRPAFWGAGLLASVCALLAHNLASLHTDPVARLPAARAAAPPAAAVLLPGSDAAVRAVNTPLPPPRRAVRPPRVWVEDFQVLPGQRFAQVTVKRSSASGQTRFTWWTEAASARAGSDFVAQHPAAQVFTPGRRATHVFVRLLPNQGRKTPELLYVAVGEPTGGGTPQALSRAEVWIPPDTAAAMVAAN
jgi:serine/threonine protein kinase